MDGEPRFSRHGPESILSPFRPAHAVPGAGRAEHPDAGVYVACGPDLPAEQPFDVVREFGSSVVDLVRGWRFETDPTDEGYGRGFSLEAFDDSAWRSLEAGRSWEEQGVAYDGVAWYRLRLDVAADWSGDAVRLVASGVDDEYDVYLNGRLLKHHGGDGNSVYNRTTETELGAWLRFGQRNTLALRVRDWGGGGGITRKLVLRRVIPLERYRDRLPVPVLSARPEFVALADLAWSIALSKLSFGTPENGLEPAYLDEGFNEQIYQWDSSFITLFARYGVRLFPAMAALDNFYGRQRADGYIQRVYSETDGRALGVPTPEEPMVNPPLFAWVELEYYRFTGDQSRLPRVYPVLTRYWTWLEQNLRAPDGRGLYSQTDLGSGMDNTPRGDVWRAAWVDMSSQQALAARSLAEIAAALGRPDEAARWTQAHADLKTRINARLWDETRGFYFDLTRAGLHAGVKHVGGFWPLLAGVAEGARATRLIAHLEDPREFARPHRFPSLAADEPGYAARGHYWRGGVWAPTNYMIAKGLDAVGRDGLAREAAENHLEALAAVYAAPPTADHAIAPEERDGQYATLWECYAPEAFSPGTRWDDQYLGRQDFVGWTGLGPIAMLYEDVIGLRVVGADGLVVWTLTRTDEHGARRMPLGPLHTFDGVARHRASVDAPVTIDLRSDRAFALEVRRPGKATQTLRVCPGESTVTLE